MVGSAWSGGEARIYADCKLAILFSLYLPFPWAAPWLPCQVQVGGPGALLEARCARGVPTTSRRSRPRSQDAALFHLFTVNSPYLTFPLAARRVQVGDPGALLDARCARGVPTTSRRSRPGLPGRCSLSIIHCQFPLPDLPLGCPPSAGWRSRGAAGGSLRSRCADYKSAVPAWACSSCFIAINNCSLFIFHYSFFFPPWLPAECRLAVPGRCWGLAALAVCRLQVGGPGLGSQDAALFHLFTVNSPYLTFPLAARRVQVGDPGHCWMLAALAVCRLQVGAPGLGLQ